VPIVFWGDGVAPSKKGDPVSVSAIAPTVASLLKMGTPNGCAAKPLF
jgi:hypothetical protein